MHSLLIQRETPLHAILIVSPPLRHADNLPRSEKQKYQKQVEIEACVERGRKDVVVPAPQLVAVSERPVHHHEGTDEFRQVAGADVAIEDREAREEDGRVP